MAQVASLWTSLTLESSSFISGLKKASDSAQRASVSIEAALSFAKGAVGGLVSALSVDMFARTIKGAFDFADAIADLSNQTGASTKMIQQFRYAAQMSGSSVGAADAAIGKFAKSLGEAQRGSKEQARLFADLEVRGGDLDTALRRTIEGISRLDTAQQKNAVSTKLFGRAAADLTPLLGGGIEQFNDLSMAADHLGIVLSDKVVRGAGEVNDKLDALKMIATSQMAAVIVENADAFMKLADAMAAVVNNAGQSIRDFMAFKRIFSTDGLGAVFENSLSGAPIDASSPLGWLQYRQHRQRQAGDALRNARDAILRTGGFDADPSTRADPKILELIANAEKETRLLREAEAAYKASVAAAKRPPSANDGNIGLITPPAAKQKKEKRVFSGQKLRLGYDLDPRDLAIPSTYEMGLDSVLVSTDDLKNSLVEIGDLLPEIDVGSVLSVEDQERMRRFAENFTYDLTHGLADAIAYGDSLGDVLVGSIRRAASELISSGLLQMLEGGVGGGGLGGFISGLFGGFRAGGGPVSAGRGYIVGENGPEWFQPGGSGQILPNAALRSMSGGGVTINQTIAPNFAGNAATQQDLMTMGAIVRQQAIEGALGALGRPMLPGGIG